MGEVGGSRMIVIRTGMAAVVSARLRVDARCLGRTIAIGFGEVCCRRCSSFHPDGRVDLPECGMLPPAHPPPCPVSPGFPHVAMAQLSALNTLHGRTIVMVCRTVPRSYVCWY